MHKGGKTYLGVRKPRGDNVWETQGKKKMKRGGIRKENREFKKGGLGGGGEERIKKATQEAEHKRSVGSRRSQYVMHLFYSKIHRVSPKCHGH